MAAIAHGLVEQNTQQTTISAAYEDVLGASIASSNFIAGKQYLIIVTAQIVATGANGDDAGVRVLHGATAFADSEHQADMIDGLRSVYFKFIVWTAVSGEDIKLQFARIAGTTATIGLDQIALHWMKLSDDLVEGVDWILAENTTDSALTTTPLDGASVTFTPGAAGDYLVMSLARIDPTNTTNALRSVLARSGEASSSVPENSYISNGSSPNGSLLANLRVFSLGASSNTFKEQSASVGASAHTRLYSAIFVLRLAAFKNHAYAYTEADTALSATAYATSLVTAPAITPDVAGDVMIVAWFGFDRNDGARSTRFRVQVDGADQPAGQTTDEYIFGGPGKDASDEGMLALITQANLSAAAHTLELEASADAVTGAPAAQYATIVGFTMELAGAAPAGHPAMRRMGGVEHAARIGEGVF